MKYKIISAKAAQAVEDRVNIMLEQGWELSGSMQADGNKFSQAMVKYDDTDAPNEVFEEEKKSGGNKDW